MVDELSAESRIPWLSRHRRGGADAEPGPVECRVIDHFSSAAACQ